MFLDMKFNFKFLLAGLLVPAGYITFSINPVVESKVVAIQQLPKPYIVETYAPDGAHASFSGASRAQDAFVIADEVGAKPFKEDKFTVFPDIKMGIGSKITIYQAPLYLIVDGKKNIQKRSWVKTVGELLQESNISLGDDDKINFAESTDLELGMKINIIRVAITNIKNTEAVDFKTVKKEDNTLDKGKVKIQQPGQSGVRTLTYRLVREDGVEISRTLINNEITTTPTEEIQIIGTKPVITGWCRYNDMVLDASIKNGLDPDKLCNLMRVESRGNADSVSGGGHLGLFQYTEGFWADASKKAGYVGASWSDPKAQIYTTAWALTHGYSGRWPGTYK
jgi:hypothetical protein